MNRLSFASLVLLAGLSVVGCKGPPVPILHDGLDTPRYTRCALRADDDKLYSAAYIDAPSTYPPGSAITITMYSKQRVDVMINGVPHKMFPARDEFSGAGVEVFLKKYTVDSLAELGLPDPDAKGAGDPPPPPGGRPNTGSEPPTERRPEGQPPAEAPAAGPHAEGFLLDKMKPSTAGSVKRGLAAVNMTKQQVFMALGPPIYINFETPTISLPLEEILKANRWVYYGSWWARWFSFQLASKRIYIFDREGILTTVDS